MYEGIHNHELYEMGWAMAAAFNEPKQLKKLLPSRQMPIPATGPLKPTKGKTAKING